MLDIVAGGTFMSKPIELARRLLDDMQSNHAQWHVERSSSTKVNSITEGNNEELTSKVDELINILNGKESTQVNAITNSNIWSLQLSCGVSPKLCAGSVITLRFHSGSRSSPLVGMVEENTVRPSWRLE